MDEPDPSRQLAQAQLTKLQLENEKLALELAKQRGWYQFPVQLVPLVTALLSVAGFLWGVLQYTDAQQKNRLEREKQSLREIDTAQREFMKPWLEGQRQIYQEALSAAATAANTREPGERAAAEQKFWQLYHGRMILVETKSVSAAMVQYGHCLDGSEACPPEEKNQRNRRLASAMAESMAATATMSYREFVENQFRYTPGTSVR